MQLGLDFSFSFLFLIFCNGFIFLQSFFNSSISYQSCRLFGRILFWIVDWKSFCYLLFFVYNMLTVRNPFFFLSYFLISSYLKCQGFNLALLLFWIWFLLLKKNVLCLLLDIFIVVICLLFLILVLYQTFFDHFERIGGKHFLWISHLAF